MTTAEKFNLSEKEEYIDEQGNNDDLARQRVYPTKFVKEFIRLLKKELYSDYNNGSFRNPKNIIDKLAGEQFVK